MNYEKNKKGSPFYEHHVCCIYGTTAWPFLRVMAECFARLSHDLGVCVCVFVHPFITLCSPIETVQARITKLLLWTAMGV